MPTTEIANLPLVAGSDVGDASNHASAVLKECGDIIASQDGYQSMKFGTHVENAGILSLFINWGSKGDHEKFMAAEAYQPFFKKFSSILTGAPDLVHVDFWPEGGATAAFSAPVTEIATFYFDDGPPADAAENCGKALEAVKEDGPANILGWAYGTTHEIIEKDGVKGKGGVLVIGWESVEAHMKARETQAFKDNSAGIRNGMKAVEVHHVAAMNYIKE